MAVDQGVPCRDQDSDEYSVGITAICALPSRAPGTLEILVATRQLRLYRISASGGKLRLHPPLDMQNWIAWIIPPGDRGRYISCISLAGDFVRLRRDDLTVAPGFRERLAMRPTAAMVFDGGVLIGTTDGLVVVDDHHPDGIAIPVTRSHVLCFGSSTVTMNGDPGRSSRDGELVYVTMGLDDGRFRVVEAALIRMLRDGPRSTPDAVRGDSDAGDRRDPDGSADRPPPRRHHNFPLDTGKPVLAVQALQPTSVPSEHAYVVAALSDHAVRLYHATTQEAVQRDVETLWSAHVDRCFGIADPARPDRRLADELAAAEIAPPGESNAWKYMLADLVLPHLRGQTPLRREGTDEIIGLACKLAEGADRIVLHRLTAAMGELTGLRPPENDGRRARPPSELVGPGVSRLLELSLAILLAVPHGDDQWLDFIESHLRELNALAGEVSGDHRTRLIAWVRFVRKYVRYGHTFDKDFGLEELVEQNLQSHKYLDALIYLARLTRRGYDLRWESRIDGEVAALQVIETRDARTMVFVVTTDGGLAVLDRASGQPIRIEDERGQDLGAMIAVFGEAAQAQAHACAAVRDGDLIRIVVGYSGEDAPSSGLAVIGLRPAGAGRMKLAGVEKVKYHDPAHAGSSRASHGTPGPPARPGGWPRSRPGLGVHAVRPLPGHSDAFVIGTETIAQPVGLLRRTADHWTVELASDVPGERTDAMPEPATRHSLAPGKMPTRALAVATTSEPGHYLVVAGSDDGTVRAISFMWGARVAHWQLTQWDRASDAISSVALGAHRRSSAARGSDASVFSCYVGTVTGDVFALSILRRDRDLGTAVSEFGPYVAQPLWREKHDSPVLAMAMWRTPAGGAPGHALYGTNEVLVTATEKGRLCIYNHVPQEGHFSSAYNYYFRGMRFERLALPDRTRALTAIEDAGEFIAAGPQGKLYLGRVAWLRESNDRKGGEMCREERDRDVSEPAGDPPREMWARLHHLFARNRHGEYFRDAPASASGADDRQRREARELDHRRKLELCKLIRVGDRAVYGYALRKQLLFDQPWRDPNLDLRDEAQRYLRRLDPEKPIDADQIKIVLRSLCRTFLLRDPDELRGELVAPPPARRRDAEPGRDAATPQDDRDRIATACEIVSEYIVRDLAYATDAAARMRISAIKELLQVSALRHMAERPDDPFGPRVKQAIATAVGTCLRDDDHLVRIETSRALLLVLRNVCTMAEAPAPRDERDRLFAALFPHGLGSLEWLLEILVDGLQRFPSFTQRTALVSAAWFHISVLLPVFQLFPDRTLALCDYLMRSGLDVEVLALCYRSLRHPGTNKVRRRIEYFYLFEDHDSREEFIQRYKKKKPRRPRVFQTDLELGAPSIGHASSGEWYDSDDATMADRIARQLDQLACMWSVQKKAEIRTIKLTQPASPRRDVPLADLEHVVAKLSSTAAGLSVDDPEPSTIKALEDELRQGALTAVLWNSRVRPVVAAIEAEWRELFASRAKLSKGQRIGNYKLQDLISPGKDGWLFKAGKRVIKIVSRMDNHDVVERFLRGARLNERLYLKAGLDGHVVEIQEIIVTQRWVAYVMPRYRKDLGEYLKQDIPRKTKIAWTEKVALHIGHALRLVQSHEHEPEGDDEGDNEGAANDTGFSHGDVQPTNILLRDHDDDLADPVFVLGDFDHTSSRKRLAPPTRIVPECLSRKYEGDDVSRQRQWDDVFGLSIVLYQLATGGTIDHRAESLRDQVAELEKLHGEIDQDSAKHVVRTVQNMLDVDRPLPSPVLLAPNVDRPRPQPRVPIDHFLESAFPRSPVTAPP